MKGFSTIVVIGVIAGCNPANDPDAQRMAKLEAITKAVAEDYKKNRSQIHADVDSLIKSGKFVEARERATRYVRFQDSELIALNQKATEGISAARERELLAKIANTKSTQYHERLLYYAELERLRPENQTYEAEWRKNRAALSRIEEQNRNKALVAERAERRRKGVSIGMTRNEVLMSSWGRPEHVNTTTTARGTREQWVYGGRSYLYFEDGILTAIQN